MIYSNGAARAVRVGNADLYAYSYIILHNFMIQSKTHVTQSSAKGCRMSHFHGSSLK